MSNVLVPIASFPYIPPLAKALCSHLFGFHVSHCMYLPSVDVVIHHWRFFFSTLVGEPLSISWSAHDSATRNIMASVPFLVHRQAIVNTTWSNNRSVKNGHKPFVSRPGIASRISMRHILSKSAKLSANYFTSEFQRNQRFASRSKDISQGIVFPSTCGHCESEFQRTKRKPVSSVGAVRGPRFIGWKIHAGIPWLYLFPA